MAGIHVNFGISLNWSLRGPDVVFQRFNKDAGGDIWFALDESRPLVSFAGLWTNWTSVRKVREGEVTTGIFGFMTTKPNAKVEAAPPRPCR